MVVVVVVVVVNNINIILMMMTDTMSFSSDQTLFQSSAGYNNTEILAGPGIIILAWRLEILSASFFYKNKLVARY